VIWRFESESIGFEIGGDVRDAFPGNHPKSAGHIQIGDDGIQQQAPERRPAVAMDGGVPTQTGDSASVI